MTFISRPVPADGPDGGTTSSSSSSGGGASSSGGGASSPAAAVFGAQNPLGSASVILYSVPVLQAAGGVPARPVAWQVPGGCTVEVRPNRTNAVNVQVGLGPPEKAKYGPDLVLAAADNPAQVSVRSLDEISVFSANVGEGVTVQVRRA